MEASQARNKKRLIAFLAPVDAHGHINAMIGLADQLRERHYRTVFICKDTNTPASFGHQTISARSWLERANSSESESVEVRTTTLAATSTSASVAEQQQQQQQVAGEQLDVADKGIEATPNGTPISRQSEQAIFTNDHQLEAKWSALIDIISVQVSRGCSLFEREFERLSGGCGCGDGARAETTSGKKLCGSDAANRPTRDQYNVDDHLQALESIGKALEHNYSLLKLTVDSEVLPFDGVYESIILHLKPDLVVTDQILQVPALHRLSSRPVEELAGDPLRWISLASCAPTALYFAFAQLSEAASLWFPPPLFGLQADPSMSKSVCLAQAKRLHMEALQKSGYLASVLELARLSGLESGASDPRWFSFALNESPWLNLFMYPSELDFANETTKAEGLEMGARWHRVDALVRRSSQIAAADEQLLQQVARWRREDSQALVIYFSLGSTASYCVKLMSNLMRPLFGALERRPNWRLALNVGARQNQLDEDVRDELARLCSSGRVVSSGWWPQPEMLRRKLVQVCITHGGNNTLCELFQGGQPPALVLLGVFHDQVDNATRVHQLGWGVSMAAASFLEPRRPRSDLLLESAVEQALKLQSNRQLTKQQRQPLTVVHAAAIAAGEQDKQRDASFCADLIERVWLQ